MTARRMGGSPDTRGSTTGQTCPDIFELDDGRFLVIGGIYINDTQTKTAYSEALDIEGASVGDTEDAIVVPRGCMLAAARQIVEEARD